tara:strand:+ start:828 stop:1436 length:609 start_codon:yes stop_codon:yes gene_type:complete
MSEIKKYICNKCLKNEVPIPDGMCNKCYGGSLIRIGLSAKKKKKKRNRNKPMISKTKVLFGDPLIFIIHEYRKISGISLKDILRLRTVCKIWKAQVLQLADSDWFWWKNPRKVPICDVSFMNPFPGLNKPPITLRRKWYYGERIKLLRIYLEKGWKRLPTVNYDAATEFNKRQLDRFWKKEKYDFKPDIWLIAFNGQRVLNY